MITEKKKSERFQRSREKHGGTRWHDEQTLKHTRVNVNKAVVITSRFKPNTGEGGKSLWRAPGDFTGHRTAPREDIGWRRLSSCKTPVAHIEMSKTRSSTSLIDSRIWLGVSKPKAKIQYLQVPNGDLAMETFWIQLILSIPFLLGIEEVRWPGSSPPRAQASASTDWSTSGCYTAPISSHRRP